MFGFTEEQQQFRDSLGRLLRADYAFERRRGIAQGASGWSAEVWGRLADVGALALPLPEAHGGFGGGGMDTFIVMEESGRALLLEPYLATIVLGAGLVARAGNEAQQAAILPAVAAGERQLALAHYEPGSRYAIDSIACEARRDGAGWVLNGAKTWVLNGATADQLLVTARTGEGLALFVVERTAAGVTVGDYPMYDARRAADIRFEGVRVQADARLGGGEDALPALAATIDAAIAAVCAEAVGAMGVLLEMTGQYLKTRKQFGVPIGSFQVLQHRMADMLLSTEAARSMALLAASRLERAPDAERSHTVSAAKVRVAEAARHVGQQAVQLHGGIGVTDELPVSHFFKRLTMIEMAFGDVDYHLDAVGRRLFDRDA
ncbi:MAG: acyl-CoA dehydrogenase family protein [Steroidobacteraceae bacterium]